MQRLSPALMDVEGLQEHHWSVFLPLEWSINFLTAAVDVVGPVVGLVLIPHGRRAPMPMICPGRLDLVESLGNHGPVK